MQSIPTWANDWVNGLMDWAHHWVNGLMCWANHRLMGWVGASYGYVSKQTRVSKPDTRIENRRAKLPKCRGGGMTTYPYIYDVYIYRFMFVLLHSLLCNMYVYVYIYIDAKDYSIGFEALSL